MDDLNYNHLRYFREVAHDGNLTRTAERLHVSQSALSVQIRKLEARLGVPLFERRGRALHLTEAGRIALDHADVIFAAGQDLRDTLRRTGHARRALRVGAEATLSRNFQMAFLRPLLGRADVELVLRAAGPAELLAGLDTLALDVVLTTHAPPRDALQPRLVHRISEQPVSLVGVPARIGTGSDLGALLAAHPLILPTEGSAIRTGFDALVARRGLRPQIAAEVDDMAMIRLLVRADAGLAVVPPIVVRDELASGRLAEAAVDLDLRDAFFAVTLRRRFPNPLLAEVLSAGPG